MGRITTWPWSAMGRSWILWRPRSEGAAGQVIERQLAVAAAGGKRGDLAADGDEAFGVGIFHDGDDEALLGGHGDAHVDIVLVDDRVAVDLGVHHWILGQGEAGGLDEERHEGEADAVVFFHPLAEAVAEGGDRRHVDFVERRQVRGGLLRLEQVLGDPAAAGRHLLACLAGAVGRRRWRHRRCRDGCWRRLGFRQVVEDVGFADHAAPAGARDGGEVDALGGGDALG
jgi:hypothetical protein